MKKMLAVLVVALALATTGIAWAVNYKNPVPSTGTTEAVAMQRGSTGQNTVLTAYSVTSDKALSTLKVYLGGNSTEVKGSSLLNQKILKVASTTGFDATTPGAGDYVMIQLGTTNQWNRISSITDGVSLNLVTNLSATTASGDRIYKMTQAAALPVGAATAAATAGSPLGFLGSDKGMPMAATLDGTSAVSINMFSLIQQ